MYLLLTIWKECIKLYAYLILFNCNLFYLRIRSVKREHEFTKILCNKIYVSSYLNITLFRNYSYMISWYLNSFHLIVRAEYIYNLYCVYFQTLLQKNYISYCCQMLWIINKLMPNEESNMLYKTKVSATGGIINFKSRAALILCCSFAVNS